MDTIWFMVDDTDPRLNYTGSWNALSFNDTAPGIQSVSGPMFNRTLHYAEGNVTVSFKFNGSSYLGVFGSIDNSGTLVEDDFAKSWSLTDIHCLLDGIEIESELEEGFLQQPVHNQVMCRNYAGSSNEPPENIQHAGNVSSFLGEHELQINITNSPNSTGWFLDYIVFESLPNPMTNGEILQAGNGYLTSPGNYSMLAFGPQAETSTEEFAVTPDANATMKFNGTSLSLYGGLIGLSIDPSNTSAYYQIDDQDPVVFQAPTVSPFQNNAQPGPLFTASNLTVGEHSGTVMLVLNASGSIVPAQAVTVDWFYVTSLTMAERASLPSSFNQPSHSGHKLNVTEIVPAVVIPTLLLLMAAVLFCIKRAKQKKALYLLRVSALPHLGSTSSPRILDQVKGSITVAGENLARGIDLTTSKASHLQLEGNNGDRPNEQDVLIMKLQQRLVVMEDQMVHERHHDQPRLAQLLDQPRLTTVQRLHTDSGLRMAVADAPVELNEEVEEVPPGYTEQ